VCANVFEIKKSFIFKLDTKLHFLKAQKNTKKWDNVYVENEATKKVLFFFEKNQSSNQAIKSNLKLVLIYKFLIISISFSLVIGLIIKSETALIDFALLISSGEIEDEQM
jgi:hypothetical protein